MQVRVARAVPESDGMKQAQKTPWLLVALVLLVCLFLFVFSPLGYRPDRPVEALVPGSSPGPAFVVQVIRPRFGLPLGGILPPQLFGQDAHLGFDSASAGATIRRVEPGRIELAADDWDLVLVFDADGRVLPGTQVTFELVFEERLRRVLCRPGDPATGAIDLAPLGDSGELAGRFDLELGVCESAETHESLGWPPKPLLLHGSVDRLLPVDGAR